MKIRLLGIALAMFILLVPAYAQHARLSPHETISTVVDGDRVMIVYGRPYTKSPKTGEIRKIWGGLVPYGKIWRTGADEATLMTLQQPIVIGGKTVPAGAYTLWTLPNENGTAELIINKQIGQWGDGPDRAAFYRASNDVARVPLTKSSLDQPVDQFTMAIVKSPSGGGEITLSWEKTRFTVPFTVQK